MKNSVISHKKSTKYLIFKKFVDIILRQKLKKGEKMLKKLSLAALVAMGGMSFANATPLTEAIKNVNVNGYLRLRFYNETPDKGDGYNRWRTNAKFVFNIPVAENLSFVWRVSDQTDVRDRATSNRMAKVDVTLLDNLFFLKYSANGLNAIVGKIPVATPITSADPQTTAHGAGAIATYNVGNGLTVAAGYVDALTNVDDVVLGEKTVYSLNPNTGVVEADTVKVAPKTVSNDIYTAAAIYSNEAFGDAQVWYFNATGLIDYEWVARLNLNLLKDYGVALHLDGAISNLDDDVADSLGNTADDSHTYYNVSAKFAMDQFCAKLGWAQTNDKVGVVELSVDSPIAAVGTTAQRYAIANDTDAAMLYGKAGYQVDPKTNVYVAAANIHDQAKANSAEYVLGGSYKVNKKFGLSAYYSVLDYSDDAEAVKVKGKQKYIDNNEFRFEAKYTF